MARPRTPTNVLEMKGAFKKDPQRARQDPEVSGKLKAPPEHLTEVQKAIWKDIVKAAPKGVITESDRFSLEICCILLAQFRLEPLEFPAAKLVRLEALLGKMGMTPADRAKVAGPAQKKPQGNPFAEL
ncbi:terminase [Marinobacter subterrani]|uniref:Terminase n=1 Tax=Marinobacter subterrani TaxID=1658765 RepID=A0A0J7JAU3_9GAMM|nr:terminase [Marinobacter subterrani]KMQ75292.1 hypothetical protein Msub_11494 [Marinobacter subterrani]